MALTKVIGSGLGAIPAISGANLTGLTDSQMPAGSVLQVVSATDSTQRSTTSSPFVTGSNTLAVNITPSSTSNKVFVTASFQYGSPSGTVSFFPTIYRDSTNLGATYGFGNLFDGTSYHYAHATLNILDAPSTTSQVTYQVYFRIGSGSNAGLLNHAGTLSSITAFEIAG
eukprot:GHVR01102993.1.p1 GENE.GHVR01102993.1~~GHVR01102993.1.p1  ORF type:complete len:170 (+),score=33.94 GHVR01102993.1:41-550(+)